MYVTYMKIYKIESSRDLKKNDVNSSQCAIVQSHPTPKRVRPPARFKEATVHHGKETTNRRRILRKAKRKKEKKTPPKISKDAVYTVPLKKGLVRGRLTYSLSFVSQYSFILTSDYLTWVAYQLKYT